MTVPKMILFDYGHTLLSEPDWNTARGNAEKLKYAVKNERNSGSEEIQKVAEQIAKDFDKIRTLGYDISGQVFDRILYDYLGIEFSLSQREMETVFWNGTSMGAMMPEADVMLDYINEKGIRSGVISNLMWSGESLTERLNRLLPRNKFEFVMTSSDYLYRKPNRILFEIALRKAGLDAKDVWFCGDNPLADVEGAARVGIFPVLYDNVMECEYRDNSKETAPQCEHLYIREWRELIETLEELQ